VEGLLGIDDCELCSEQKRWDNNYAGLSGRQLKEFGLFFKTISSYTNLKDKVVLDLCCQWGDHMKYLMAAGAKTFGVDIADFSLKPHPRYEFLRSDAQNLAIKPASIDIVFCINAFEHIPDPERALREIYRILKPGGYAFISFIPVFYSDVGSHMADFISEPWAHLKYSEPDYISKLRAAVPGTEYWVQEYQKGLNRRTRKYFHNLFEKYNSNWINRLTGAPRFKTLVRHEWMGVTNENHLTHKNFIELQKKYAKEDLLFQGMYVLLEKN
jgi:ubiquinone/menaquinone biosynthesis C-methylase UbiE